MTQKSTGTRILSVIGQQGSGKSTVGWALAGVLQAQFIEASDIVTEVTGVSNRTEMPTTNERTKTEPDWLGEAIFDRIENSVVVLSGVREKEVHNFLRRKGVDLVVIKLWCPENMRFGRVLRTGKVGNYVDFKLHGENELKVGLEELLAIDYPEFVTESVFPERVISSITSNLDIENWIVKSDDIAR